MKLKYTFESIDMEDEIISVSVGNGANQLHGILKMNREGKDILELLKEDTSESEIINTLSKKYGVEKETISDSVNRVIDTFRTNGLLIE